MVENPQNARENQTEIRQTFERPIRAALTTYAVSEKAFAHSPDLVIAQTAALLDHYEMDPKFAEDPEKLLFATAVANQLLSESNPTKQRGLHSIVKLLAIGPTKDKEFATQSAEVRKKSQSGDTRSTWFDPEHTEGESSLETYIETFKDADYSRMAKNSMKRWGRKTELDHVRKKLGITREQEKDFDVVVLNKTEQQFLKDRGARALCMMSERKIVLPLTHRVSSEHEYAHTQGTIRTGLYGLLFRGLDEAHVERSVSFPQSYKKERLMVQIIEHTIPGFRETLTAAFLDNNDARITMLQGLVGQYALDGFLAVTRAHLHNPTRRNWLENYVYIPTSDAISLLEKKDNKPYLFTR